MNYLYFINIRELNWSAIKHQKKILPVFEQNHIEQFKFDQDKVRSLMGKMLLLYALKKQINYQADVLPSFTYNDYKKPKIDLMQGGFNISHAGDWVICGYNMHGDIGVDIEKIVPINIEDFRAILTDSEYQCAQHDKTFDFFQLWTLKEAIIKADGRGFYLLPTSFEIPKPFKNNTQITISNKTWFLYTTLIDRNHCLAIASNTIVKNNIKMKQVLFNENDLSQISLALN